MKTELNQEQFSAVEGWIKNFPITSDGSSMLSQFNKYFAPKQIPNEAVCYTKEAKHNEREMAVKEAFKQIMNDIKSPQMAFLSFNIDDFFERERPKAESEIKIGDRVKLKNDANSPEMTVTRDLRAEAQVQKGTIGKGVQEETKYSGMDNNDPYAIFECSYFINKDEDVDFINRNCRQFQFHKDALQKLIPVQPSNKQKPTIESDIKAGDVVEMDDTKERFYVEELQTHGVKLVKVACYKLAAGNIYLTNYENMPFKKVERLNKQ